MSKIVALDFGLKRTGIAISDESESFAFPLETIDSKDIIVKIRDLIKSDKIAIIVLGLPRNLDTSDTHITGNVLQLKSVIEKSFAELKVELVDERFTSRMASDSMHIAGASKKQKKDKALVDKVSATIILQSFLESRQV